VAGLALGAVVALALTLVSSVRQRRRDLARLEAIGFVSGQFAALSPGSPRWQPSWASSWGSGSGTSSAADRRGALSDRVGPLARPGGGGHAGARERCRGRADTHGGANTDRDHAQGRIAHSQPCWCHSTRARRNPSDSIPSSTNSTSSRTDWATEPGSERITQWPPSRVRRHSWTVHFSRPSRSALVT
jgi:hypothetical protein